MAAALENSGCHCRVYPLSSFIVPSGTVVDARGQPGEQSPPWGSNPACHKSPSPPAWLFLSIQPISNKGNMCIQMITSSKHDRTLPNDPWQFLSLRFRQHICSGEKQASDMEEFVERAVRDGCCSLCWEIEWGLFGQGNKMDIKAYLENVDLLHSSVS